MIRIREAQVSDAKTILNIYGYYVKNTAISFEYEVPELDEFQARMKNVMKKYPYLVAEVDGEVKGYAYAGPFIGRAACDWSCELSIYISKDKLRCGLGKVLYAEMEQRLKDMGILNLYASIAYPIEEDEYLTKNSAQFHENQGFQKVGEFHKCGYKFHHWYNLIWMEKIIGKHQLNQTVVKK